MATERSKVMFAAIINEIKQNKQTKNTTIHVLTAFPSSEKCMEREV